MDDQVIGSEEGTRWITGGNYPGHIPMTLKGSVADGTAIFRKE